MGITSWSILGHLNDAEFQGACNMLTFQGVGPGFICKLRLLRSKAKQDLWQSTAETSNAAHMNFASHSHLEFQRLLEGEVSVACQHLSNLQAELVGRKADLFAKAFGLS